MIAPLQLERKEQEVTCDLERGLHWEKNFFFSTLDPPQNHKFFESPNQLCASLVGDEDAGGAGGSDGAGGAGGVCRRNI